MGLSETITATMARVTLVALCLTAFLAAAHCRNIRSVSENEDFFYFQLDNGTIIKEDLTKPVAETKAFSPNDVTLYLYTTKTGKDSPCKVTSDSCTNWKNCGFDANKRTVVLVHGYTNSYESPAVQVIKDAYFQKKTDINIVILDYKPVNSPYLTAVSSAKSVGQTAAKVFTFLKTNCGLKISNTECVGHSLGSHVCGLFSAALPEKVSRIVCLDAAGPVIGAYGVDGRLDASDAVFVHCIHTSSDGLGQTKAIGHNDFYPNGASNQVGCENGGAGQALAGGCDHAKACTIFADSILYPNMFPAHKQCDNADQALSKKCTKTPSATTYLGEPNKGPTGIFYIDSTSVYASYQKS